MPEKPVNARQLEKVKLQKDFKSKAVGFQVKGQENSTKLKQIKYSEIMDQV